MPEGEEKHGGTDGGIQTYITSARLTCRKGKEVNSKDRAKRRSGDLGVSQASKKSGKKVGRKKMGGSASESVHHCPTNGEEKKKKGPTEL